MQVDRVRDGRHRIGVPDDALDRRAGGLANRRQRVVELAAGLTQFLVMGVDDLVQAVSGSRHEQREDAGAALRPLANRLEQWGRRGGLVLHDEDFDRGGGLHGWNSLLTAFAR